MSAVYTSGLGTYLWDGVGSAHAGQAHAASAINSAAAAAYSANDSSIDIANISERARLFSGLETLSRNNLSAFAKTTAGIANNLKAAASKEGDSMQESMVHQLATSFESASKSGKFSDLFSHEAQGMAMGDYEPYAVSQVLAKAAKELQSV